MDYCIVERFSGVTPFLLLQWSALNIAGSNLRPILPAIADELWSLDSDCGPLMPGFRFSGRN